MNHHTPRSRTPGKRNPAGSKIARRFASDIEWKGEIFHGGALTAANNERAAKREHRREVAHDNDDGPYDPTRAGGLYELIDA